MLIFVDSDGVLQDFNLHVFNMFGQMPRDFHNDDIMWDIIKERADEFWSTMPQKFGAMAVWEKAVQHSPIIDGVKIMPTILTGCPKSHFDLAASHKIATAKRNFGDDVNIITCLSRNKPLHLQNQGDILIDDMNRNVRKWIKAGGRGVFYRDWEQAIIDLEALFIEE